MRRKPKRPTSWLCTQLTPGDSGLQTLGRACDRRRVHLEPCTSQLAEYARGMGASSEPGNNAAPAQFMGLARSCHGRTSSPRELGVRRNGILSRSDHHSWGPFVSMCRRNQPIEPAVPLTGAHSGRPLAQGLLQRPPVRVNADSGRQRLASRVPFIEDARTLVGLLIMLREVG